MRDQFHYNGQNNGISHITISGIKRTLKAWCEISGIKYNTLRSRVLSNAFKPYNAVFDPLVTTTSRQRSIIIHPSKNKTVLAKKQIDIGNIRRKLDEKLDSMNDERRLKDVWDL